MEHQKEEKHHQPKQNSAYFSVSGSYWINEIKKRKCVWSLECQFNLNYSKMKMGKKIFERPFKVHSLVGSIFISEKLLLKSLIGIFFYDFGG